MKLLLVRHGQSVANAEGRIQGQVDSPLNELGRKQARALAARLHTEDWALAAVYSSDLSRAAETAAILGAAYGLPVLEDIRLREYDLGVLNNMMWNEIEARYPDIWRGLHHRPDWVPLPGEEGKDVFHARIASVLTDIGAKHDESDAVAVVSHGASLGMILTHYLDMDSSGPVFYQPFLFGNTSLSIMELTSRGPRLLLMNDTGHLKSIAP
jgi:probable phosphoglycerate mutase